MKPKLVTFEDDESGIIYKFNAGEGAVLCRKCRVIIAEHISYVEAVKIYRGRDLCDNCKGG